MTFDVILQTEPMTLDVQLGEVYDVTGDEYERGYAEGYSAGEVQGQESGYQAGYQEGYPAGEKAGYAEGAAAEQDSTDGIISRSISGSYSNDRITKVGKYGFYACNGLTSIDFPALTSIAEYGFYRCIKLTSVALPALTSIAEYGFYGCLKLISVDFPALTSIEGYGFYDCRELTSVDFSALTSIKRYAFSTCSNLTTIILRSNEVCTLAATNAFNATPIKSGTGYIYVPDNLVDSYKAATNWSTYADQIKPLSELK